MFGPCPAHKNDHTMDFADKVFLQIELRAFQFIVSCRHWFPFMSIQAELWLASSGNRWDETSGCGESRKNIETQKEEFSSKYICYKKITGVVIFNSAVVTLLNF